VVYRADVSSSVSDMSDFTFFFGCNSPFSNFHRCDRLIVYGKRYISAEQMYHYGKAGERVGVQDRLDVRRY